MPDCLILFHFSLSSREGNAVEMMYLTENPVQLSGEKYEKEINYLPPYIKGIQETISWMMKGYECI